MSVESKKDIDGLLWKQCYYKQIEEFRRSIKKTTTIIEENTSPSFVEKAQAHLLKLTGAFLKFLTDALSAYQEFMLQVYNGVYRNNMTIN